MLTSFGIATIGIEPWFVPVVAILLLIGLWGFWRSARTHRNIWPLLIAIISSGAVVAGRLLDMPAVLWAATASLLIAYVIDWLMKNKSTPSEK